MYNSFDHFPYDFEPQEGDRKCQDIGLSQIIKLIVSTSEKILNNINVIVRRQVK